MLLKKTYHRGDEAAEKPDLAPRGRDLDQLALYTAPVLYAAFANWQGASPEACLFVGALVFAIAIVLEMLLPLIVHVLEHFAEGHDDLSS